MMDESYSFCMDDACEKLVSMYKGIIETEESDLSEQRGGTGKADRR